MKEFIEAYWMQGLWTILLSVITWLAHKLVKAFQSYRAEQEALKGGVLTLQHDRIYEVFRDGFARYNETGRGTTLEERRNMKYLFEGYETLGGNGNGKDLYKRYMALPIEESEVEQ